MLGLRIQLPRIAVGLLALAAARATDYYVSTSGFDSAPGTLDQPFQTIQKAASVMVAGDTAYIRAGVYRETVTPANSGTQYAPITYMPYNSESVTVSGADVIPAGSWTLYNGSIYKAPMAWSEISTDYGDGPVPANQVFLDGQMMIEARWPNTTLDVSHPTVANTGGGSYIDGGTGVSTGTITDPNLPSRPAGYWNGATINMCLGVCYWWQAGPVTDSSTPQQLTFTFPKQTSGTVPGANNSYFLTGKLTELDAPGEWFRDDGTSALFLWTPLGDNPSGHLVEAKHRPLAFDLGGLSFITIQGIGLFAATITSDARSQYLLLDGLQCQYIAQEPFPLVNDGMAHVGIDAGIALRGKSNVLRNSTIAFSSGSGVYLQGTGQRVLNNIIHDTDYIPTYASPIAAGTGVVQQNQQLIAYNTIYNSGRYGVLHANLFGQGRILHNEIYDYGLQTNDLGCNAAGGTDGMGTEIAYNLCHDGQGLLLNNSTPYTDGIYLDNGSSNFVVHHNVVWNVEFALQLNAPSTNEQVFNNDFIGAAYSFNAYPDADLPGTVIENNIFVSPITASPLAGVVMRNNILPGTDPQFVDPANNNYQLQPTSPAIAAGLVIPPYTNGYSGAAPDIGAYDHTKPPWKAGVQNAATVSAPSYAPTLTRGTIAVVTGSIPFDSGVSVLVTDGANVDWPARLVYVLASPPRLAFQVPTAAAPGVAMITITNGDGTVSLSSAPLFAGAPPITIAVSQGSGQSGMVDTSFATVLQATVKDTSGNIVPGVAVTFAPPATGAGGTFEGPATVKTNASGIAIAPGFTANAVAGTYAVTASASGVAVPAAFSLTNSAGAPATVAATQGSGQRAAINTAFVTALQATVQDAGGNPVPGAAVTFTVPKSGASGTFAGPATVQTGTSGVAAAPTFTANGTTGNYSVTAIAAGVGAPASFALTNTGAASTISPGGIAGVGGSVPPVQSFSQNTLISIYGQGFLPPGVAGRHVLPSEYVNGGLPTMLLGVCVDVSGQPAAMLDVYPTQINAQFPMATGISANLRVQTNCGTPAETASAPQTVALSAASPEFLYYQRNADGANPVVLVNAVTGAKVGPSNIPGGTFTPARIGDLLTAYGTGFGTLRPALATGQIPNSAATAVGLITVSIGGVMLTAKDILYAGAAPGLVIDQLNFRVPTGVTPGNQPVVVTIAGVSSPPHAFVAIQH